MQSVLSKSQKKSGVVLLNKDKPLPGTPAVNVTESSPCKSSRTLLDATEHPPLRKSPGTPEERDWPALSPEKQEKENNRETAIISSKYM